MHSIAYNAFAPSYSRFVGLVYAADARFQSAITKDAFRSYWLQSHLTYVRVAQSIVQFGIAILEIEAYNNFRGQFIEAHRFIGRVLVQSTIEGIKAGIVTRRALDMTLAFISPERIPALSYTNKLTIFLSGHGEHEKEVI